MLRSFNKHFNETVFRGPDMEGAGGGEDTVLDTGGSNDGGDLDGGHEGGNEPPEKEAPLTVREQIKASMKEVADDVAKPKPAKDAKTGRFAERTPKGGEAPAEPVAAAPAAPAVPAPESLPKEAKAEWDKTPPAIQQAFVKREEDMARGVQDLKNRYTLIDQAIAPHTDALRQMNASPGEAVNRMFLWFKALAGKPADAFPALAQSMGIDWAKLSAPKVAGAAPMEGQQAPANGAPEIPEPVKQYVGRLEGQLQQMQQYVQQIGGRFGSVENTINEQNQARTVENLNFWSKDKPYFQEVRQEMGKLIETGIVPLKDGQVDLDTAYERAIYLNPTVRAKVLAEQQQANNQVQQQSRDAATTAQQTQVNRARKASVSLPATSTPGSGNGAPAVKRKPGEKTSVRDSLKAAVAQLRDQ